MKEDELSEDAVALLNAGKNAKMSDESRERLRSAIFAQIAAGGGAAAGKANVAGAKGGAVAAKAAGWSTMAKSAFVASAIVVAGGGIYLATKGGAPERPDAHEPEAINDAVSARAVEENAPQAPPQQATVEAPALAPEGEPGTPSIPALPQRTRQTVAVETPEQQLEAPVPMQLPAEELPLAERVDEEARLIRNAIARNREGHYEDALRFLRTHAMLHPSGTLSDERTAAQIEALCGLHRNDEAVQLRTSFLSAHPNSPLRARMMAACNAP